MPTPAPPPRATAPTPGRPTTHVPHRPLSPFSPFSPLVLLALVLLLAGLAAPAAALVPSTVLPGDAAGSDVALDPPVVRAPEGRAEIDVVVGDAVPGDVLVRLEVREPAVDRAGIVTVGEASADASVTAGSRLRPGERLRTVVTTDAPHAPVLLVATVRPASPAGGETPSAGETAAAGTSREGEQRELVALVLPGDPGPAPTAMLEVVEGTLRGTIEADAAVLVSVRLRGAASTTFPDRLVLPGEPLVVQGEPAAWPLASVLTVTDEEGRTVSASTDREALLWITVVLLIATAGVTVRTWRRRRRRRADGGSATTQ